MTLNWIRNSRHVQLTECYHCDADVCIMSLGFSTWFCKVLCEVTLDYFVVTWCFINEMNWTELNWIEWKAQAGANIGHILKLLSGDQKGAESKQWLCSWTARPTLSINST